MAGLCIDARGDMAVTVLAEPLRSVDGNPD